MSVFEHVAGWFGEQGPQASSSKPPLETWLKIPRLRTLLPYEGYDPESKLFFNRNATGFVLQADPLVGASLKDQGQMADFFRQEYHLTEGTSLQFMLWASPQIDPFFEHWLAYKQGDIYRKLAERRIQYLEDKAFSDPLGHLVRDFKVIISYTVPGIKKSIADLEQLKETRRSLQGALQMIGMPSQVMDAKGLLNQVSDILNVQESTRSPNIDWNEWESLSHQILDMAGSWKVEPEGVSLRSGACLSTSYVPRKMPKMWGLPHMDKFLGNVLNPHHAIPCPYLLHYGLFVEPHQSAKRAKTNARRESLENSIKSRMTKWIPGLQERHQETVEAVEQLQLGERCILSSLSLTTFCRPEQKSQVEQSLRRIWTGLGWEFTPALYDHLGVLLSSLPMMWTLGEKKQVSRLGLTRDVYGCAKDLETLGKARRTITRESQNMLPILGEWKGQSTPGMILVGRRGQPFFWSPFGKALVQSEDMTTSHNYNVCIAGSMGSGKSVLMNELMTNVLSVGGKVIVLDKGRSFKNTCHLLGGQHIEFNIRAPLSLNPFTHIPTGTSPSDEEERKEMLALLNPIVQMMASPYKGTTDAQDNHIAKAIKAVWSEFGRGANIDRLAQMMSQQEDKEAREVGHLLHQFTQEGDYGCFFNPAANVDLSQQLVVIETDDLRNHDKLLPVIIQMLIIQVNQIIARSDRSKPFIIMIDEAWELLKGKKTGNFIEQAARTVRKYKGSLILATQSTKDYFREESPGATVAWECSEWKCILAQDDGAIQEMKNIKALQNLVDSDYKESLLKSLKPLPPHYSELALFGKGIHGIVGRLRLDPFSRLLYSSNADEYRALQLRINQGMSVEQAIEDVIGNLESRVV
ncbi:MAG: type IV secretion system protein TraC [Janthinobacterium lividum]